MLDQSEEAGSGGDRRCSSGRFVQVLHLQDERLPQVIEKLQQRLHFSGDSERMRRSASDWTVVGHSDGFLHAVAGTALDRMCSTGDVLPVSLHRGRPIHHRLAVANLLAIAQRDGMRSAKDGTIAVIAALCGRSSSRCPTVRKLVSAAPTIKKAVMVDSDNNGKADEVVLTYSSEVNHPLQSTGKFPSRSRGTSSALCLLQPGPPHW